MPSRCHQRSTYGAVGTMRRRWIRPAISIPAATSATRRTTPDRTARSRTACWGTGVKTTTPTSTPTSMIPLRICSVTRVPTSVVTGTLRPRATSLRRSTVTRATSPRRAISTVFRRKPMKIGRDDLAHGHVERAALVVTGDGVERRLPCERLGGDRPEVRDERREHEHRVDVGEDVGDDLEREALRDEQHQGGDDDGEGRGLERRPPLWPQLLGELRDGHRLEAALPHRLEDVRHRLDGLRPVAALTGAVAVVQEQDRARAQHVLASGDDRVDPGPAPCRRSPRSTRPSGSPAVRPPPRRTGFGSRGAHGRASTPCRRRPRRARCRPPGTGARSPAGRRTRAASGPRRGWRARGPRPRSSVRCRDELAPGGRARRTSPGRPRRAARRARPASTRGSAVVEGDGDHRLGCRAQADDPSEEAGVRRERRPGHRHQDQDGDGDEHLAGPPPDLLSDHRRHRQPDGGGDYEANDDVALAHTGLTPASRSS